MRSGKINFVTDLRERKRQRKRGKEEEREREKKRKGGWWKKERVIYAEVVTFVAGSLEAGGLPGYSEVLVSLK